jgi:hypothetical protein
LPPAATPRTKYLETYGAVRLVRAFTDAEYRVFNAMMAGSGVEVTAALSVRRRDVYPDVREVRLQHEDLQSRSDRARRRVGVAVH